MVVTALKTSLSKASPNKMLHIDYKNFEQDKFKYKLKNKTQNESIECCNELEKTFVDIVN